MSNPKTDSTTRDILETRLFKFLSTSDAEIDFEPQIKEAYREFVERLIFYLDSETDNMKRIRTLNLIHIEIETVKSLEVSYGAKKDVLKIVYSDKVLSFLQKELELIHKELEFPRYFIKIETSWQSPLYLTDETYLIEIIEMVSGLFLSKRVVTHNGAESPLTEIGRAFEYLFNIKLGDVHKKHESVVSRKPSKITEFLDTLRKAIDEESKKKGYL